MVSTIEHKAILTDMQGIGNRVETDWVDSKIGAETCAKRLKAKFRNLNLTQEIYISRRTIHADTKKLS